MPISYGPDQQWPPPDVQQATPYYEEWLTWWRGVPGDLSKFYMRHSETNFRPPPSERGGIGGWLARQGNSLWWGRQSLTPGPTRLHVPAAADVSSYSASLLFADPPTLSVPESTQAQERLETIIEDAGIDALLHEAAEKGSAAGGVYVRLSANADVADVPIAEAILPDVAVPEFYGPFLTAVTFWWRIEERGAPVRHLERHEMINGKCYVEHAVYEGSTDRLGRRVALADYPATARFAELVDDDGRIEIGTTKLDVVYVPNIRPHKLIPDTQLGRSDYAGAEGSMDALDETWSSWMRDIRLGKGRAFVPRGYVKRGEAGGGGLFDPEQEVFSQVLANPGEAQSGQLAITVAQFAIRVDEHERTARNLTKVIFRNGGYDGNEGESENTPETATGVNDRSSRKRGTRAVKMRYWTPALRQIGWVLLELSAIIWRTPPAAPVVVEWPDASAPDMETLARTLQLLDAAGAISTQTKVEMLHPDWEQPKIDAEIERIDAGAAPPEDPGTFTGDTPPAPVDDPGGIPLESSA